MTFQRQLTITLASACTILEDCEGVGMGADTSQYRPRHLKVPLLV